MHYHYCVYMKSFLRDPLFYELYNYKFRYIRLNYGEPMDNVTKMIGISLIIIVKMNLSYSYYRYVVEWFPKSSYGNTKSRYNIIIDI